MASATMFTRSGETHLRIFTIAARGFDGSWLGESVQAPVGVVE
jgi:hypothetical protein